MSADGTPGVFFSIVVPVLNREGMIRRAIDGCLCQDFGAFEVIVVDDGSTDDTARVVESYTDPRVRLVPRTHRGNGRTIARADCHGGARHGRTAPPRLGQGSLDVGPTDRAMKLSGFRGQDGR